MSDSYQRELAKLREKAQNNRPAIPPGRTYPKPERHSCPRCCGLRWLRQNLPVGHPEFGRLIPCPDCTGPRLHVGQSGLSGGEIENLSWDKVLDAGETHKARRAVQEVLARGHGWVYLYGGPGIAKSLILKVAVAEVVKSQNPATYVNMSAILDDLRQAYDTQTPNMEAVRRLERWTRIPFLAVDELDKVKDTEYVQERRMRLLDDRYQAALRGESITLFASNRPPEHFENYITDRIRDGRFSVVELIGQSARSGLDWTFDI